MVFRVNPELIFQPFNYYVVICYNLILFRNKVKVPTFPTFYLDTFPQYVGERCGLAICLGK